MAATGRRHPSVILFAAVGLAGLVLLALQSLPRSRETSHAGPEASLDAAMAAFAAGDFAGASQGLAALLEAREDHPEAARMRLVLAASLTEASEPDYSTALEELRKREERLLRANVPLGSLHLHYRGLAHRGIGRELLAAGEGGRRQRYLIESGEIWRYRKGRREPPPGWQNKSFRDGDWLQGRTGIGFGDSDDRTVLGDMMGRYVSVFLRKSFPLPQAVLGRAQRLVLRVSYDDGFVARLNGQEVQRQNMPGRPGSHVPFNALASVQHEAEGFDEYELPVAVLQPGLNTLAVQVHQVNYSSSDLSLDAELVLVEYVPPAARAESARELTAAAEDFRQVLEPAVRRSPLKPELEYQARLDLAETLLLLERPSEALEALAPLVERGKTGSELNGLYRCALYLGGMARLRTGEILKAGEMLSLLSPFGSSAEEAHAAYLLARVHHRLGERPEALGLYESVIDSHSRRRSQAAVGFQDLPQRMRAQQERQAQELAPDYVVQAELFRAVALFELGRVTEAQEALDRFRARRHSSPLAEHATLFAGIVALHRGAHEQALELLGNLATRAQADLLRVKASLWAARSCLAWAERMPGEGQGDTLRRAGAEILAGALGSEAAPDLPPHVRAELAELLLRSGRLAEATALHRELAKEGSTMALPAMYHQAVTHQLRGEHAACETLCRRILTTFPGSIYEGEVQFRVGDSHLFTALKTREQKERTTRLEAAVDGYSRALALPTDFPHRDLAKFRRGLCELLLGKPEAASTTLSLLPLSRLGTDKQLAPAGYLRARLLLDQTSGSRRDAVSAARALERLKLAETLLDGFLKVAGEQGLLGTSSVLALARCQRRRGELLADERQRSLALLRGQQLTRRLTQRHRTQPLAARALLEDARVSLSRGDLGGALTRLAPFRDQVPWKRSGVAPDAILYLALTERTAGQPAAALRTLTAGLSLLKNQAPRGSEGPGLPSLEARMRLERGRVLVELERPTEARSSFEATAGAYPRRPQGVEAALELARLSRELAAQRLRKDGGKIGGLSGAAAELTKIGLFLSETLGRVRKDNNLKVLEAELLLELGRCCGFLEAVVQKRKGAESHDPPSSPGGKPTTEEAPPEDPAAKREGENSPHRFIRLGVRALHEALRLLPVDGELAIEVRCVLAAIHAQRQELHEAGRLLEEAFSRSERADLDREILVLLGACRLREQRGAEALWFLKGAADSSRSFDSRALLSEGAARLMERVPGVEVLVLRVGNRGGEDRGRAQALLAALRSREGRLREAADLYATAARLLEDADEKAAALYGESQALAAVGDAPKSAKVVRSIRSQFPLTRAGVAVRRRSEKREEVPVSFPDVFVDALLTRPLKSEVVPRPSPRALLRQHLDVEATASLRDELLEELAALKLAPAPLVNVELGDPRALLSWLVVDPEPRALAVEPPRDPSVILEDLLR